MDCAKGLRIVFGLVLLTGCVEEGPRDRSLMARAKVDRDDRSSTQVAVPRTRRRPDASLKGLVPDPLARLYPTGTLAVLRLDSFQDLEHTFEPRLREIGAALSLDALARFSVEQTVREAARLAEETPIAKDRPLAFLLLREGWVVLLPTKGQVEGIRPLNQSYGVAGHEAAVKAYVPGGVPGHFLGGPVCLSLPAETACEAFRTALKGRPLLAWLGCLCTPAAEETDACAAQEDGCTSGGSGCAGCGADGTETEDRGADLVHDPLQDLVRLDVRLSLDASRIRMDARAAFRRESLTAQWLDTLKPGFSRASRFLPPDGSIYIEGLFQRPLQARVLPEGTIPSGLQGDLAAVLDLDRDGRGTLYAVGMVEDADAARGYLGSPAFLNLFGGEQTKAAWQADALKRHGLSIGRVEAQLSKALRRRWRKSGDPLRATLATLMKGPIVGYAGFHDSKLWLVVGDRAKSEAERFLDRLRLGGSARASHIVEGDRLFPERIAAVHVDAASLFDGTRRALRHWHPRGSRLQDMILRWPIPATSAVTVQDGTLRLALQVGTKESAAAAKRISLALAGDD